MGLEDTKDARLYKGAQWASQDQRAWKSDYTVDRALQGL